MRAIIAAWIAVASLVASLAAHAVSTTNFTDQWWKPSESGWGASFLQQGDVIFVDLFVYGSDGRPTWYTAAARLQGTTVEGELVFGGDLFQNTGPYFAGPFNPANVGSRKVGTLTFESAGVDNGNITYTVDGNVVAKGVTRQLWTFENFSGNYYGGVIYDLTQCANPANNGHVEELGVLNINHTGGTITMATQTTGSSCNFVASYSQAGHMGTMQGSYSCSNGVNGSFTAFEMEKSPSGMTGRVQGQNNFCQFDGHFGGLLR